MSAAGSGPGARDALRRRLPPQPRASPLRRRARPARPGRGRTPRTPRAPSFPARGARLARRRGGRVLRLAAPRRSGHRPVRDVRRRPPGRGAAPLRDRHPTLAMGVRSGARRCARRRAARERRLRQAYEGGTIFTGLETGDHPSLVRRSFGTPRWTKTDYLATTPIVEHIRSEPGRYATWAPPAAYFEKGYLWMKSPADWPALAPTRGTLFEVPDALGYNPVQLPRYWRYIRATNELSVFYNASVLNTPSVEDVRLLGLRYLVVPTGLEPPVGGPGGRRKPAATPSGSWTTHSPWRPRAGSDARGRHPAGAGARDRAGLRPIDDRDRGTVDGVTPPGDRPVVGDPRPAARRRRSGYDWTHRLPACSRSGTRTSPAGARPRTDDRWPTLPVDGFLQGVQLPSSTGEVVLTYHDDAVMLGPRARRARLGVLLAAPLLALARERRAPSRGGSATRSPPQPLGAGARPR